MNLHLLILPGFTITLNLIHRLLPYSQPSFQDKLHAKMLQIHFVKVVQSTDSYGLVNAMLNYKVAIYKLVTYVLFALRNPY